MVEFNRRRPENRRKTPCFIAKDRRKPERRGQALREIERKRRKDFERHLNAQRG